MARISSAIAKFIYEQSSSLTSAEQAALRGLTASAGYQEHATVAAFPLVGTAGVLYYATATQTTYTWDSATEDYTPTGGTPLWIVGDGYSMSLGEGAIAYTCGVAIGVSADASEWGIAVGCEAAASLYGTGIGHRASGGARSTAVGVAAEANNFGIAIGESAVADAGIALGYMAIAENYGASLGCGAQAVVNGTALGDHAFASDGMAFGTQANAVCGLALGRHACAGVRRIELAWGCADGENICHDARASGQMDKSWYWSLPSTETYPIPHASKFGNPDGTISPDMWTARVNATGSELRFFVNQAGVLKCGWVPLVTAT